RAQLALQKLCKLLSKSAKRKHIVSPNFAIPCKSSLKLLSRICTYPDIRNRVCQGTYTLLGMGSMQNGRCLHWRCAEFLWRLVRLVQQIKEHAHMFLMLLIWSPSLQMAAFASRLAVQLTSKRLRRLLR